MTELTPEFLREYPDEVISALQKEHRFEHLINAVELTGTSLCGDPELLLRRAPRGSMLFPVLEDGLIAAVSDRGEKVGYIPPAPILKLALQAERDFYMRVEYSADLDGIPQIIVSLWCRQI